MAQTQILQEEEEIGNEKSYDNGHGKRAAMCAAVLEFAFYATMTEESWRSVEIKSPCGLYTTYADVHWVIRQPAFVCFLPRWHL